VEEEKFRIFLKERTYVESDLELFQNILLLYPKLLKSKIVKKNIQTAIKRKII
jgi:hypothetical protein